MKIYKKDSKGKIRSLNIVAEDGYLIQTSGLLDGKKVEHKKLCKAKNVGRSNETDPIHQAKLESASLIIKKIREGYFYSEEEALSSNVIMPMLAKEYFKEKKKLTKHDKIAVQPKLDGIRCITHYVFSTLKASAVSRQNKPIINIDPILTEIEDIISEDSIFDGELYVHGKTFQEVSKLVKNPWGERNEVPQYWIYDIIVPNTTFQERSAYLKALFADYEGENIVIVPTKIIDNTEDSIKEAFLEYIELGYEGMMIRVLDSEYKIKGRSSDLLKYKEFETVTLPIADITPNDAKPTHGTVWTVFNGNLQKTGAKLSHVDREDLLTNKEEYIGRMGEFRYFEETDAGLMRFPVFLGIRDDK